MYFGCTQTHRNFTRKGNKKKKLKQKFILQITSKGEEVHKVLVQNKINFNLKVIQSALKQINKV